MENVLKILGENSKYQKIITIVSISTGCIPFTLTIAYSYLTKMPEFLCKNGNGEYTPCEFDKNLFCARKIDFIKDKKSSVNNFTYDLDLYCNREFFISIYSSLYFLGALLSSMFLAPLPDKYGRKTIFQILQVCTCIILLIDLLVVNPWQLAFLYLASGICSYNYGMISVIIAEYLPRNIANIVMSICNGSLSIMGLVVGLFFKLVNNKTIYILIVFCTQTFMTYLTIKYFQESLIWLFSLKLKNKFINAVTEIGKINGKLNEITNYLENNKQLLDSFVETNNNNNDEKDEEVQSISFQQIYSYKSQRSNMLKTFLTAFSIGLTFYGIILNLAFTKHNFYITCYCCFAGEILGELSSGIIANIFGRVKVMSLGCFIGGACYILYTFGKSPILSYISVFCATCGFASTFNVIFIYTPELFPTPIRAKVCGYGFLMSRIGAMSVGPVTNIFGAFAADLLFFFCAIFSGIIITSMEETLGQPLKNSIPEMEGFDVLLDKTMAKFGKKYYLSQNLFSGSFIGYDAITFDMVNSSPYNSIKPCNKFSFSGIYSRK